MQVFSYHNARTIYTSFCGDALGCYLVLLTVKVNQTYTQSLTDNYKTDIYRQQQETGLQSVLLLHSSSRCKQVCTSLPIGSIAKENKFVTLSYYNGSKILVYRLHLAIWKQHSLCFVVTFIPGFF